ncbi:ribosome production factor 1 (nucleomorph) [Chroomonas mesostigmatica CCMP1168]|uniref:Ribosome production factor 1 n=1 Tax=Chroomonas mesostigmatica CCMP1168 TaxID=1195612 RepID=J7G8V1_9CRYP|nr:ribosome production factor 1 [Chroomonas mesostigmatica CCMP1168]|mmetsp:Transcript_65908/g.162230  ORF Transcript_65908/g.162230 Transcript_65908/m.162230 type:complete len:189 (-) Transcript_65908:319-885(-)
MTVIKNTIVGITTSSQPSKKLLYIIKDFLKILDGSKYFKRKKFKIKQILCYLKSKEIKTLLIFKEKKNWAYDIWIINMREKVSIHFQLKSILLKKNFQDNNDSVSYKPEIILKNFNNKTGKIIFFLLKNLFPFSPNFKNRNVVSFFYRNNLIFFRFYRYIFSLSGKDVKLQELGPRFIFRFCKVFILF